ncbi:MAG: hypothetical protein MUP21_00080 [Dehalococcoidia bacterium]|nr:hypothetical protein [Dehalococcoidia bacterium]
MRSINDMIRDADEIFEKRASKQENTKSTKSSGYSDEDIFKLAEELRGPTKAPVVRDKVANDDGETKLAFTLREQIVHSAAIIDTLLNLEQLVKCAALESAAREKGFSEEQIQSFFEKNASVGFRSILSEIPALLGK